MDNPKINIDIHNAVSGVVIPFIEDKDPITFTLRNVKDAIIAGNVDAATAVANGSRIQLFHDGNQIGNVYNRVYNPSFNDLDMNTADETYEIGYIVRAPGPMTITVDVGKHRVFVAGSPPIIVTGVHRESPIEDLKYTIYVDQEIPMAIQLLYKDRTLLANNANTLESYGIVNNAEKLYMRLDYPVWGGGGGGGGGGGVVSGGGGGGVVSGGRRKRRKTRRRKRKKTRRRRRRKTRKEKRQLIKYARRAFIAKGDKRFKATKDLVRCTRVSKRKGRTTRIYHRRKCRKNEIMLSH